MRALLSILTGAGIPLGVAGLLYLTSRVAGIAALREASRLALLSGLTLGALGAVLGWLAVRRRVSPTPLRDALQLASILPALVTLVAVLRLSHEEGVAAALFQAPFLFLPGPAAAACSARLWRAAAPPPRP